MASEGEGGLLAVLANRYHLPLRGKLGWMTPRAGVKTTLASEMRLPGLPDPKRGPHFFWLVTDKFIQSRKLTQNLTIYRWPPRRQKGLAPQSDRLEFSTNQRFDCEIFGLPLQAQYPFP